MMEVDIYEKLREKISSWPVRVPKARELMEMLKVLFTVEEAEFLTHFTAPYQDGQTLDQIIKKQGSNRKRFKLLLIVWFRGVCFSSSKAEETTWFTTL